MAAKQDVLRMNIRAELARRGLRQEHLAEHLGITQAAVSMKLRDERPIADKELVAIAEFLDVEPGDLFRPLARAKADA